MTETIPIWMWVVGLLAILGPLVTLHELGHYLVGRWFGVGAEKFSIGIGKELVGWDDKRGTHWRIALLPLGGYVQFKGDMNAASMPESAPENASERAIDDGAFGLVSEEELEEDTGNHVTGASFHTAALWKRALIVFAGPAMNILITVAIFAAFNMTYGEQRTAPVIADFSEGSAARDAGLQVGDRIIAVDDTAIEDFAEIREKAIMFPNRTIELTVERDGVATQIPVKLAEETLTDRFGNESRIGLLGVRSGPPEWDALGPIDSVARAGGQAIGLFDMMITGIGQIFTGERSVRELGGFLKIAKYSGEQLSLGPLAFASFAALISINLAFINLLPIPTLDGGHLAFYAAEAVRRKPVSLRGQELAYRTGLALVLMLMLFVTINDIVSLPVFSS